MKVLMADEVFISGELMQCFPKDIIPVKHAIQE